MTPAAADFSHPISSSQPFSQNPNPSFPASNGKCETQSSSFNFDNKASGSYGLSFDFSKKSSDLLGQQKAPRIRVPLKKKRGKLSSSSEIKDFENVLRSDCSNPGNKTSVSNTSSCNNVLFSGDGGVEFGKSVKMDFVFGANGPNGYSSGLNLKKENEGFVFGADESSSTSDFSNGNGNSVFGANKSGSASNFSDASGSFVFRANKSGSASNFRDGSGSFAFGADKDSSVLNSTRENGGVRFGDETSSLQSNLNTKSHGFVFRADKISSDANMCSEDVGPVFGARESSSILNSNLGKQNVVVGTNTSDSTFNSSLGNGSFASKSNLSSRSNLGQGETSGIVGQSGADESKTFDNGSFVFDAKKGELASDSGLEQKVSSDCKFTQSGVNESGQFINTDFVFGTDWNVGGKEDHPGFSFVAKHNSSGSSADVGKSEVRRCTRKLEFDDRGNKSPDLGNEFCKADVNDVFVFGNSSKEKPNSSGSSNCSDKTNRMDGERAQNVNAFVKLPTDATRSNFKFVIGVGSTPGSAVYKIPLSKLFDEMKGLNIDNSKGINGADKVKDVGSNSRFSTDNMFVFDSNGQTSGRVSGKENRTSNSTEKVSNGNVLPQDQSTYASNLNKTSFSFSFSASATSDVQQNGFSGQAPPTTKVENKDNLGFTTTPVGQGACSSEFNKSNMNESYSFTRNLFPGLRQKSEFSANSRCLRGKRLKKIRGKLRQPSLAKHSTEQDYMSRESTFPNDLESPGRYSPMDFSPCQDTTANARGSACTSMATENKEENLSAGRQGCDINEGDKRSEEQDYVSSNVHHDRSLKSSTSSSAQDGLSAIRCQYRKKYKLKVGDGLNRKTTVQKSDSSSSSTPFSPNAFNSSRIGKAQIKIGVTSKHHNKADGLHANQEPTNSVMHGECEQWRIRGNQAYKSKDLPKAEEYYTKGINSIKHDSVSGFGIEPLLLCYSNRAATRMSLGRMREALEDCKSAAAVDPSFLKVKLRAANCHLVLGEFQEAMQYYNNCLESGNDVCLDRRIIIEAADGLQKAQKVSDYMCQSAELLRQRTSDAASSALIKVGEGLSISCYSEKLLKMKGEAFFLLQRYDELIKLCEQTLHTAEKNFSAIHLANDDDIQCKNSARLWRWCLMSKSHFHLGRLELALDLIEKQEQSISISNGSASVNQESSIPLAATIRELLHRKKAGNGAFQSGKHTEAVEHYTAAISSSVESRAFAAICFCNRAAAHQALGLISDAIADCSLAIALDGDYLKAVSRRATLHEMIRDYKQATSDLQRLISLLENQSQEKAQQSGKQDGSKESNRKELKQARRRLSLIEDKAKKGIPMDFYLILGIKASDTESDIKKAYRKAALKHHPDKAGQYLARSDGGDDGVKSWKDIVEKVHEDADRLFKLIGEAYAVLSDPDKRLIYDYEENTRNFCSDSNGNTDSGRPSDSYGSPYDRGHWSGRQSNFSSSQFGRSRSRRSWHDTWRSYDDSRSQW